MSDNIVIPPIEKDIVDEVSNFSFWFSRLNGYNAIYECNTQKLAFQGYSLHRAFFNCISDNLGHFQGCQTLEQLGVALFYFLKDGEIKGHDKAKSVIDRINSFLATFYGAEGGYFKSMTEDEFISLFKNLQSSIRGEPIDSSSQILFKRSAWIAWFMSVIADLSKEDKSVKLFLTKMSFWMLYILYRFLRFFVLLGLSPFIVITRIIQYLWHGFKTKDWSYSSFKFDLIKQAYEKAYKDLMSKVKPSEAPETEFETDEPEVKPEVKSKGESKGETNANANANANANTEPKAKPEANNADADADADDVNAVKTANDICKLTSSKVSNVVLGDLFTFFREKKIEGFCTLSSYLEELKKQGVIKVAFSEEQNDLLKDSLSDSIVQDDDLFDSIGKYATARKLNTNEDLLVEFVKDKILPYYLSILTITVNQFIENIDKTNVNDADSGNAADGGVSDVNSDVNGANKKHQIPLVNKEEGVVRDNGVKKITIV